MCSRDCKKTAIAIVAAFIVGNILDVIVHHVLLNGIYHHPWYATLWNSPPTMKSRMPMLWLASAIFYAAFVIVYTHGYEDEKAPIGQGLRYGFWIALLGPINGALMEYFIFPVSIRLASAWVAAGLAETVILGVIVALIYQPKHAEN